jgi:uncharacterized coiled-coil DUF342 family protein
MTNQQIRDAKETVRDELDEINADLVGLKYDRDEAVKAIYAAQARKAELRAKLAELRVHARVEKILLSGIA